MGSAIAGMRGSGDWDVPDHRPKSWLETAFKLFPQGNAKLVYFLSKLGRRAVRDHEYNIFEDRLPDMAFTVAAQVAANATTITIDAPATNLAKMLKAGDMLKVEAIGSTAEVVYVVANPVSPWTSINVIRYWNSTNTGGTIAEDAVLRWVGSAYGAGTRAPLAVSRNPDKVTNYLQTFKETAKVTRHALHYETRPFKNLKTREKYLALERYVNKAEFALMMGEGVDTVDAEGNQLSTTKGITQLVTTNVTDFTSSGVDLDSLEDALETQFMYGSEEKLFICGNRALTIANRVVARNTMATWALENVPKQEAYGLSLKRWYTPHGVLVLVPHKLLTQSALYKKWGFIMDPKYMEMAYLNGMYTKWYPNTELPDESAWKGYFEGVLGLSLALEETHGIFQGMDAYTP